MPEIEVDEEIFHLLEEHAKPFTDSPNTVLRRLLGLKAGKGQPREKRSAPSNRASPGSILPESEYEVPILEQLVARGGRAHATEITNAVGTQLADRLTDLDRQPLDSGEVRWRNRVQFTRLRLKDRGLLSANSPRGIWEITPAGEQFLVEAKKDRPLAQRRMRLK
jgi:hypothetical protein